MSETGLHRGRLVFDHHISRVIAACRSAMVGVFVIWVMLDGDAPIRHSAVALFVLLAYFAYSLGVLATSFLNWWLDFLLQRATLVIDCIMFFLHVWLVLTTHTTVVTPFMAFFCFIVLSAAYRWRWQVAFAVAVGLALGYLVISGYLLYINEVVHYVRMMRRGVYMFVLSGLLVWFAARRRGFNVEQLTITPDTTAPIDQVLRFALEQSEAQGAAVCWANEDEPYTRIYRRGSAGDGPITLDPGSLDDDSPQEAVIFDKSRRRTIRANSDGGFSSEPIGEAVRFAELLSVDEGIVVPLRGHTGTGLLLLTGISGMTSDDAVRARMIGDEIARALNQEELASLSRDAALMRVRAALARDLHDSVAQTLAGARFRLQSIRKGLSEGSTGAAEEELLTVEEALLEEQALLRDIIQRLRRNEVAPGNRSLGPDLVTLVESLSRRWGITGRVEEPVEPLIVPSVLAYAMQQLVREGFANAVRHGRATTIVVAFERVGNQCRLSITDNGSGFADMANARPRSMSERVGALNGTLGVFSRPGETRIELTLPLKGHS